MDALVEGEEVEREVLVNEDIDLPPLVEGSNREDIIAATKADNTLAPWRHLADEKEKGFFWDDGLLFLHRTDPTFQVISTLVLPQPFRERVLMIAHEGNGHLGHRKVLQMLRRRFTWPLMTRDVTVHCQSCIVCQRCSRAAVLNRTV